jgi:hypothetical protein
VPSTDNVRPQRSQQIAAGLAKDLKMQNLALTLEGYYKKSDNIIGYKEGASFLLIEDPAGAEAFSWEDNITSGQGWAYGIEVLLQRKTGRLSGWIGYTLSWTQLQFDEVNLGEKYYAKHDRRHDVSVVGIFKIKERITLSGTWVYGTGNALTLPLAEYSAVAHIPGFSDPSDPVTQNGIVTLVNDFGEKNNFRAEAYHRMDLGIQFHKKRPKFERTLELSVYNLYSHKNPFFYYIDYEYSNNSSSFTMKRVLKKVSLFPIIPSISISFKF